MIPKIIGASLILIACGGMGMTIASSHRRKEIMLKQLIAATRFMSCELQYRQTALPPLLRMCAQRTTGPIAKLFAMLEVELERQLAPDVSCCMSSVLKELPDLPELLKEKFTLLGSGLGRFDIIGQISGLEMVAQLSERDLNGLLINRDARLRSYTTLGLCAGAALVILFI